ncbi:MAG TPA: SDR family oxidoreductase [Caulobacteraceae bacterium]|nr:SDR family oxidoreductase [Caulobacteraceae bacterium]
MAKPLEGQVALVAGATRGAGRGIACALGDAGADVWCTGRSSRAGRSPMNRPETIEETAELIAAAGGRAHAVRVDHTREDEVAALAQRIGEESGRLDVLVNDVWGGDPMVDWSAKFWAQDIGQVRALVDQAVVSHLITARYAAPLMIEQKRGLIVEITDGLADGYRGQLLYDLVKAAVLRLGYAMAWDLKDTGVTALSLSPGFLRSEHVLEHFGVTEADWREAAERDPLFAESETPFLIGRGIAALAADPDVGRLAGAALASEDLVDLYGLEDVDGRTPHVYRHFDVLSDRYASADGPLDDYGGFFAWAAYLRTHRDPAKAGLAERLAAKLGWTHLPAALGPQRPAR